MKANLVEASNNSLQTLDQDFERTTKTLIKEQEAQFAEDQLLKAAMAESLREYNFMQFQPKPQPEPFQMSKQKADLLVIHLQLQQKGFKADEIEKAVKKCPKPITYEAVHSILQGKQAFYF